MTRLKHPSGIPQKIVDKVFARRGRIHAFESLNPAKTALVVIDLDTGTAKRLRNELDGIAVSVNSVASKLRSAGGKIAWITTPVKNPSKIFRAVLGEKQSKMYKDESRRDSKEIWHKLDYSKGDIFLFKKDKSAFFPGKCKLHVELKKAGIDTLLVAGAVTNVCCESSARDASELGYKIIMVSDALWGHKEGQHEATLATIYRNFGDVRPSFQINELIESAVHPLP